MSLKLETQWVVIRITEILRFSQKTFEIIKLKQVNNFT